MTEQLKKSGIIEARRKQMIELLQDYCRSGRKASLPVVNLGGELGAIPWYKYAFWTFPTTLIKNPEEAFTGSFTGGKITTVTVDCNRCVARIHFNAVNSSGAASNTRFPPFLGGSWGKPSVQF